MNTVAEMLRRAALRSAGLTSGQNTGIGAALVYREIHTLTDTDIEQEIIVVTAAVADITRQLNDDLEATQKRGDEWRMRARKARRLQAQRLQILEGERKSRTTLRKQTDEVTIRAAKIENSTKLSILKLEAAEERNKNKAEIALARQAEQQSDARMFVNAARDILNREQFLAIWARVTANRSKP